MPSPPENIQGTIIFSSKKPLTKPLDFLDDRHYVVLSQRIVQRTGAQNKTFMQDRPIHKRFSASLDLLHNPLVQSIKPFLIPSQRVRDRAKTDDGQFHWRHEFQLRDIVDQRRHVLSQDIVPCHMGHHSGASCLLDHPGQLECIEAARLLKSIFSKPGHAAKTFIWLGLQIGRYQAKRLTQEFPLAHNGTTTLDRRRQPLMRIQRHRIGTIETCVEMRDMRVENAERAIRTIDMQPETLLGTEVGQLIERVNRTGIDSPCTGHHTKRSKTRFPVGDDRFTQSSPIHFELLAARNHPSPPTPYPIYQL